MSYKEEITTLLTNTINDAIRPYSTYATTYRELREQYMDRPGNWKNQIAKDTGLSPRQIARYEMFITGGTGQARNPDKAIGKTRAAFVSAGQSLPPIKKDVPPNGLTVTISGTQGSGRHERDRDFTVNMDYSTAIDFANNPTLTDFFDDVYPDFDAVDVFFGDDGDSGTLDGVSITAS
jgi:hypothetical protein